MTEVPSFDEINRHENDELLSDLVRKHHAKDVGSISWFYETLPTWVCPCCIRSKSEIARLDKNDNLLCAAHEHHDHYGEYVRSMLKFLDHKDAWKVRNAITAHFERFGSVVICNDCNVAEPVGKKYADAPAHFTFAPFEIAIFINVKKNVPHTVDAERAKLAYGSARSSMKMLEAKRLALVASFRDHSKYDHPLLQPIWRALACVSINQQPIEMLLAEFDTVQMNKDDGV